MYLVVFRNRKRADHDAAAYAADAARMEALAGRQDGFLGFKSYVADDGEVVALSEWRDAAAATAWRAAAAHVEVQQRGRADYYQTYTLFACDQPHVRTFERTPS